MSEKERNDLDKLLFIHNMGCNLALKILITKMISSHGLITNGEEGKVQN